MERNSTVAYSNICAGAEGEEHHRANESRPVLAGGAVHQCRGRARRAEPLEQRRQLPGKKPGHARVGVQHPGARVCRIEVGVGQT